MVKHVLRNPDHYNLDRIQSKRRLIAVARNKNRQLDCTLNIWNAKDDMETWQTWWRRMTRNSSKGRTLMQKLSSYHHYPNLDHRKIFLV
jgi:hypothetical protein